MNFFKQLIQFIQDVANDERIPARDKTVLLALVGLILSPIDLIPDWIPIIGVIDDIAMLALVLDYFFNQLDQNILLSHFPWSLKRYIHIRRACRLLAFIAPGPIKRRLWKYEKPPY